jgi:hypothetical protein
VAATSGSQNAASLELATGGAPVMAIGGFNNQGGNLTLAQFKEYVAAGDIHYYIASSGGPGGGGGAARGGAPSGAPSGGAPSGGPPSGGFAGGGRAGGAAGTSGAAGAARVGGAAGAAGGPGGGSSTSAITAWVKAHYKAVSIGGQTMYDLTQPLS